MIGGDRRIAAGFDRLAPWYDALARLLPGDAIARSQLPFLGHLRHARRILIVGGGTGRFLAALLDHGFRARVLNLDLSAGMLARSQRRVERAGDGAVALVEHRLGGVERLQPGETFDAICTHCFLDLFDPPRLRTVLRRLDAALRPGGIWLCSDFAPPPPRGGRRPAQRLLLWTLYRFFRLTCGIDARSLPPIRREFQALGYRWVARRRFAAGALWSGMATREGGPGRSAQQIAADPAQVRTAAQGHRHIQLVGQ